MIIHHLVKQCAGDETPRAATTRIILPHLTIHIPLRHPQRRLRLGRGMPGIVDGIPGLRRPYRHGLLKCLFRIRQLGARIRTHVPAPAGNKVLRRPDRCLRRGALLVKHPQNPGMVRNPRLDLLQHLIQLRIHVRQPRPRRQRIMILDAPGLLQGLSGPRKGIRHSIPIQLGALRHTLGFNRLALRDLSLNLGNQCIQVRLGRRNVRPGRLDCLQHPIRLVNVRLCDADCLDQTSLLAGRSRSQISAHINLLFRLCQCCLRDLHIMVDR